LDNNKRIKKIILQIVFNNSKPLYVEASKNDFFESRGDFVKVQTQAKEPKEVFINKNNVAYIVVEPESEPVSFRLST